MTDLNQGFRVNQLQIKKIVQKSNIDMQGQPLKFCAS